MKHSSVEGDFNEGVKTTKLGKDLKRLTRLYKAKQIPVQLPGESDEHCLIPTELDRKNISLSAGLKAEQDVSPEDERFAEMAESLLFLLFDKRKEFDESVQLYGDACRVYHPSEYDDYLRAADAILVFHQNGQKNVNVALDPTISYKSYKEKKIPRSDNGVFQTKHLERFYWQPEKDDSYTPENEPERDDHSRIKGLQLPLYIPKEIIERIVQITNASNYSEADLKKAQHQLKRLGYLINRQMRDRIYRGCYERLSLFEGHRKKTW